MTDCVVAYVRRHDKAHGPEQKQGNMPYRKNARSFALGELPYVTLSSTLEKIKSLQSTACVA